VSTCRGGPHTHTHTQFSFHPYGVYRPKYVYLWAFDLRVSATPSAYHGRWSFTDVVFVVDCCFTAPTDTQVHRQTPILIIIPAPTRLLPAGPDPAWSVSLTSYNNSVTASAIRQLTDEWSLWKDGRLIHTCVDKIDRRPAGGLLSRHLLGGFSHPINSLVPPKCAMQTSINIGIAGFFLVTMTLFYK